MTQQLKYFCDSCERECLPEEGVSTFAGALSRLSVNLEKQVYKFAQDYCSECSEVILNFISELKRDVKSKRSDKQVKHGGKSDPEKK